MTAQLIVQNNTGHALHFIGCGAPFQILLSGPDDKPTPAWAGCATRMTVRVGTSTYRVPVKATYNACTSDGGNGTPACGSDGKPPPLPAGDYVVTTYAVSTKLPVPSEASLTVVPQGTDPASA